MDSSVRRGEVEISAITSSFIWKLEDFVLSMRKLGKRKLKSPVFFVAHIAWQLVMYQNVVTTTDPAVSGSQKTNAYISLFLRMKSLDKAKVSFSLSILNLQGDKFKTNKAKNLQFHPPLHSSYGHAKMIKVDELLQLKDSLLQGNALKISCQLSIEASDCPNINSSRLISSQESERKSCLYETFKNINVLFDNNLYSDVRFNFGKAKKIIHAHKSILTAGSTVFEAMFTHNMRENRENVVVIQDIEYRVFRELLRFLYTGQVINLDRMAKELLVAADMYSILRLKTICEKKLSCGITADNAVELLILADTYNADLLRQWAIEVIVTNLKRIVNSPDFVALVNKHQVIAMDVFRRVAEMQVVGR